MINSIKKFAMIVSLIIPFTAASANARGHRSCSPRVQARINDAKARAKLKVAQAQAKAKVEVAKIKAKAKTKVKSRLKEPVVLEFPQPVPSEGNEKPQVRELKDAETKNAS